MDIRPDFAVLYENGSERRVDPGEAAVGQLIRIRPGERVPLDCTVTDGESAVDASALTGESVPVAAAPGTALASGSVNLSGLLTAEVTAVYGDSTVQKILDLVSEAGDKKGEGGTVHHQVCPDLYAGGHGACGADRVCAALFSPAGPPSATGCTGGLCSWW